MFYSQLLLSKKGALGIVWMAAHCHTKLKKDQVQQTDISSSVDKILDDEVPVVTHRILAFLLLGVVRIYSKKVEYLFHDCREILNKLCGFQTGKTARAGSGLSLTHYHSIALPKTFELDAFDLELPEDQNSVGEIVRSDEQVALEDGRGEDGSTSGLLVLYKENMPLSEAYTPARDLFSPHGVSSSGCMSISLAGLEVLRGTSFCLEDRLDPFILDEAEEEQMHSNRLSDGDPTTSFRRPWNEMEAAVSLFGDRSNTVPSVEMLRGTRFSSDDCMDLMVLDEAEKEQPNDSNDRSRSVPSVEILCGTHSSDSRLDLMVLDEPEKDQPDDRPYNDNISSNFMVPIQDVEFDSVANPSPQGSDLPASPESLRLSGLSVEHSPSLLMLDEPSAKEHEVEQEKYMKHLKTRLDFQEEESTGSSNKPPGAKKIKLLEVIYVESLKCKEPEEFHLTVVTPDSKLPEGLTTPEVAAIQTPAANERPRILKKRNTLIDSTMVLPNEVIKNWIEDPSDLKRKKREVPRTPLHAWRARKLGNMPESLFEPLIPGISTDLAYLGHDKSREAAVESVKLSDAGHPISHGICDQIGDIRSPVTPKSPEQLPIAPGTPVTCLNSSRPHEVRAIAGSQISEPTASFEGIETLELDAVFQEETDSFEGVSLKNDTNSTRTRMTAGYLSEKLLDKKRREEEEVLNLSELLTGKMKKESARFFYEILVLKTRGNIDVQQENAYDDILLRPTSEMKLQQQQHPSQN